jgi:hypothetical protein
MQTGTFQQFRLDDVGFHQPAAGLPHVAAHAPPGLPPGITLPAHISSRAGTQADRSTSSKPGRTDA